MDEQTGLRDRKKYQTRQQIADAAAALFAERGYDTVSMADVAQAADVSGQTVYNYFSAKQDLVLDQADQIRDWYDRAIRERGDASPATSLGPLLSADIERYRTADLDVARGEFLAQSVTSPALRRFVLEERERQTRTIADAITGTTPDLPAVVALTHAAALVGLVQHIHDQIGASVLDQAPQDPTARRLQALAGVGLHHLDRAFATYRTN